MDLHSWGYWQVPVQLTPSTVTTGEEQPECGPHDMTFIPRVLNSFLYPEARGRKRWIGTSSMFARHTLCKPKESL